MIERMKGGGEKGREEEVGSRGDWNRVSRRGGLGGEGSIGVCS